jgi:ABC-2 type transport system ATP-binding protein
MSLTAPVAEFDQVAKVYSRRIGQPRFIRAVDNVSLRIEAGEVFGLLGPNRAGKTTLIKVLLSLCRPTSGRIVRLGQPLGDRQTLGRVGYMHENQAFPQYLTAAGLLEYYGSLSLLPASELQARIPVLLEQVGLADRSQEPIRAFSKGMVQRLALAQALINDPDLLVLDEPTAGLDLEGRSLVHAIIQEQRRKQRTVLLVSHVLTDIEHLCDRVAVLVQGRLVHLGPLAQLTSDPTTGERRPLDQVLPDLFARQAS